MPPSRAIRIPRHLRQPTMGDVARAARVSQATVSYVLNGRAEEQRIPQATVDRILAVCERLKYRRDYLATAMSTRQTGVVGVVFTNALGDFMDQMLRGIHAALRQHGLQITVHLCDDDPVIEAETLDMLRFRHADGVVAFPVLNHARRSGWNGFLQTGKPVIFIDSSPPGITTSACVCIDDFLVGEEAAYLFHGHGVRRVTLVGRRGETVPHTIRMRQEGFHRGVQQTGLTETAMIDADDHAAVRAALDGSFPTDGLFAARTGDLTTAVKELVGQGDRLASRLVLASCGLDGEPFVMDNLWWLAEQPVYGMGLTAGAIINDAIIHRTAPAGPKILPFEWRVNRLSGASAPAVTRLVRPRPDPEVLC